jgi:hypothetical protein
MERPPFPTERDVLDAREQQMELRTHVAYPGRVQSYDAATQTADIVPLIRQQVPQPDGSYVMEELPVIPSVPVLWPRVGRWFMAMALQPEDTVQLLVNTSAIGHWRTGTGDVTDPGDLRRQHISHAVAIPGLFTRGRALSRAPRGTGGQGEILSTDDALVIGSDSDGPRITMRPNGSLTIACGSTVVAQLDADGTWHFGGAAGDFVALASLVSARLESMRSYINAHTHPVASAPGTSGVPTAPLSAQDSVAATKVRAT